jgi:hypothetical protein
VPEKIRSIAQHREIAQTVCAVDQQRCEMRERDIRIAASKTLHQWRHSFEQGPRETEAIGQFRHH